MMVYTGPTKKGRKGACARSAFNPKSTARLLRVFRKAEDGAATVLTLFIFIMMLVMGGIGIDMMRFEMERARLQATLDAAVLAGAGAPFGEDPEAIVRDYFVKAEMSEFLSEFEEGDVVTSLNASSVHANAEMTMDTFLMRLSGVENLTAVASATAETRIPKLEIALVLDVSNSMNNNNKIGNLQTAAKDFVTTIINSAEENNAVISIVPFSTSVAPSDEIFDALLVNETHTYSNCLVFDDDDYNSTALLTDAAASSSSITLQPIDQAIYTSRFDNSNGFGTEFGIDSLNQSWRSCYTEDGYRIRPFSANEAQLHGYIDDMIADGNTTGSLGVKWGAALLDPTFNDVTTALIASGSMDSALSNVPVAYNENDTVKAIVMMGDGQNTTTYFLPENSDYRGPNSTVFKLSYTEDQFLYVYNRFNANIRSSNSVYEYLCSSAYPNWLCEYQSVDRENYYIRDEDAEYGPGLNNTNSGNDADNLSEYDSCDSILDVDCDDVQDDRNFDGRWYINAFTGQRIDGFEFVNLEEEIGDGFVARYRMTWEEAWGQMTPDEYGDLTGDRGPDNEYENSDSNVTGSQKDTRMGNVCTAAKSNGVVIYTIGFEIAEGGIAETALQGCASSLTNYYRVEGVDITGAFSSIAGNVQSLRLTQ